MQTLHLSKKQLPKLVAQQYTYSFHRLTDIFGMQSPFVKSFVVLCLVLISYGKSLVDGDCYPTPDTDGIHYIIGYGSLINESSKKRTHKNTGENIPVQVKGYERQWNLKGASIGFDATYLGVVASKDSIFNGVVFQLPISENVSQVKRYDERERFYCRKQVSTKDIKMLVPSNDTKSIRNSFYWIYVNKADHIGKSNENCPTVQSYIDIFISGCIEIGEKYDLKDFAKECIGTTHGWNALYWVNDRPYPRRPWVFEPRAREIDETLHAAVPLAFKNIRLE